MTDLITHVVTDANADLEQNQSSGAKSIAIHVSLTSDGIRVLLATYAGYSFGLHRYLIKKSDHNDKLLGIETTFNFVSFADLLVSFVLETV